MTPSKNSKAVPAETPVYQLKITLKGLKPPIWRRILVPGAITLNKLHRSLQIVMGWEDYHLHSFSVGKELYGVPEPGWGFGQREKDDRKHKLQDVVPGAKMKFLYIYDFGDDWIHEILVEKILPPDKEMKHPVCLDGKLAGPPEDCGGVWGYAGMIEVMNDPEHKEHESVMEWLGDDFDPEVFDIEAVNVRLRKMR
jgi:hypothetical protein